MEYFGGAAPGTLPTDSGEKIGGWPPAAGGLAPTGIAEIGGLTDIGPPAGAPGGRIIGLGGGGNGCRGGGGIRGGAGGLAPGCNPACGGCAVCARVWASGAPVPPEGRALRSLTGLPLLATGLFCALAMLITLLPMEREA